ncbi:MAG: acetate--CoA ligase [Gammaproteobacteria bacterium]|nr:acetate--CoA ligase [Gammaproteobacteria bacterium]
MTEETIHPVSASFAAKAHLRNEDYQAMYRQSVEDPHTFWAEKAQAFLTWSKPFTQVCEEDFHQGHCQWFADGELNVAVNCIDRHLPARANQTAILWEGDDPSDQLTITYTELYQQVCRLANLLKTRGISKGDRVCIYMPMIPEALYAMLACARIGAVHTVVFGGFSADALKDRILDCGCTLVITANEGVRGGKIVPLKVNVDKALLSCFEVHTTIVVKRTDAAVAWDHQRDIDYQKSVATMSAECEAETIGAEDPLFILYTSGSTGKPKGVLHTSGGYLLMAAMSFKYTFDYQQGEVFWCTADVGWVTGHSYIVYGPLCNGATTLMFEGVPTYPDASRCWQVIDKHKVNIFYTAPTAIRALMGSGDEFVNKTDRSSLKLLGTVGEPINPEAWEWYFRVVGKKRCPIVDTWWQTETGAHMITPLPGATDLKPGSATTPFFGVQPALIDENGNEINGEGSGALVIKASWPSMVRSIYGDHQRMIDTYFAPFPGYYFTGDGARRDSDGYYWITGRIDDVINVSGHLLGTAEIESAIVLHPATAEAAVVGYPHDIKGQGIYCYVSLKKDQTPSSALHRELIDLCAQQIGPIAKPDIIQWAPDLPKTRSGKIMRRILRKIACNELNSLGDTSTLADPEVVTQLIEQRANQ